MEVGEINSKDNNNLGMEKIRATGITSLTISLVRVREQSKYNIPCFSSGMRLENCLQFQNVHIRFVDSTYLVLISIPSRTMLRYFIKLLMAVIECKNPLRFVEEYMRA